MKTPGAVLLAPSPMTEAEMEQKYNTMYYLKGAAAGGICCSITHGALTPVDVVVRKRLALFKYQNDVESYRGEKRKLHLCRRVVNGRVETMRRRNDSVNVI